LPRLEALDQGVDSQEALWRESSFLFAERVHDGMDLLRFRDGKIIKSWPGLDCVRVLLCQEPLRRSVLIYTTLAPVILGYNPSVLRKAKGMPD